MPCYGRSQHGVSMLRCGLGMEHAVPSLVPRPRTGCNCIETAHVFQRVALNPWEWPGTRL